MGAYGNIYTSPRADTRPLRACDLILEMYTDTTAAGGADSVTLGTDTKLITDVAWMYPVTTDTSAAAVGVTLGRQASGSLYVGEGSKIHNVYFIGGVGYYKPRIFKLSPVNNPPLPDQLVWEIARHTLSGGTVSVTYNTDLSLIKSAVYGIPIEVVSAAPTACGVSSLGQTAGVLRGGATDVLSLLWGGFGGSGAATSGTYVHGNFPYLLPGYDGTRASGDLVGEIISKTLDGSSPSTVTITASSDCEVIRHIEAVIPVTVSTTASAVGWAGDRGATGTLYGANAKTDTLTCLVLGR